MSKWSKYSNYNLCCDLFQQFQKRAEDDKSWFELGSAVGLEVVDDEEAGVEEERTEEDREVQKIVEQGREVKRKIVTGKFMNSMYVCRKSRNNLNIVNAVDMCIMSKGSKLKIIHPFQLSGLWLRATVWLRMDGACSRRP